MKLEGIGRIESVSLTKNQIRGMSIPAVLDGVPVVIQIDAPEGQTLMTAFQHGLNLDVVMSQ